MPRIYTIAAILSSGWPWLIKDRSLCSLDVILIKSTLDILASHIYKRLVQSCCPILRMILQNEELLLRRLWIPTA